MKKNYLQKMCKPLVFTFFIIMSLAGFKVSAQYCVTNLGGAGCSATDQITDVEILGTTLINLANTCSGTTANTLTEFPASGSTTTTLTQGQTYSFSVTTSANNIISVWIDSDNDSLYEPSEWLQIATSSTAGNATTASVFIPFSTFVGPTGMRIRSRTSGNPNGAPEACTTFFSGETEDYTITIALGTACVAPPTAGTTVASATSVCSGTGVTLSLNGNTIGSGQTYQWETSPDSITWTPYAGATGTALIDTITTPTYYRCVITCSGQSSTSTAVFIGINPPSTCYCVTGLGGGNCTAGNFITSVTILGTNFNNMDTTCTTGPGGTLTVFPDTGSTTTTLTRGQSYVFDITTDANNIISIWIDYDQNGIYDTYEWKQVCTTSTAGVANTISIDIPWGVPGGLTGMRIRSRVANAQNDSSSACKNFGSGEAEDYKVTIDIGTNTSSLIKNTALNVQPNPATNNLIVSFTNYTAENSTLKLLDLRGQLVYSENLTQFSGKYTKTLDVSNFAKGIYTLQLISKNGVNNKKVVIE